MFKFNYVYIWNVCYCYNFYAHGEIYFFTINEQGNRIIPQTNKKNWRVVTIDLKNNNDRTKVNNWLDTFNPCIISNCIILLKGRTLSLHWYVLSYGWQNVLAAYLCVVFFYAKISVKCIQTACTSYGDFDFFWTTFCVKKEGCDFIFWCEGIWFFRKVKFCLVCGNVKYRKLFCLFFLKLRCRVVSIGDTRERWRIILENDFLFNTVQC